MLERSETETIIFIFRAKKNARPLSPCNIQGPAFQARPPVSFVWAFNGLTTAGLLQNFEPILLFSYTILSQACHK